MVISFDDLGNIRSKHARDRIVFCGGCFDLLHIGHVRYLERCRILGDVLIVAVSSDKRVRERKGDDRPVIGENDRADMLASLKCVDYALVASGVENGNVPPTIRIIRALKPDVFASSDERMRLYVEGMIKSGTEARHVPENRLESTTAIIGRIRSHV